MTRLDDDGLKWSRVGADGRREQWSRTVRCEGEKERLEANLRKPYDLALTESLARETPARTAWLGVT